MAKTNKNPVKVAKKAAKKTVKAAKKNTKTLKKTIKAKAKTAKVEKKLDKAKQKKPSLLIAFGGNALDVQGQNVHQKEEFIVARKAMEKVVDLLQEGYERMIITHGNGPQVGRIFLQQELTINEFPRQITLDVCGADSQGRIGYIMQNVFDNICVQRGIKKKSSTVITQVAVDANDPAFQNPTKPIGVFYSEETAKKLMQERGWQMIEDAGRGWRRVVPSPKPIEIIEKTMFKELLNMKFIAIGAGGGGIPVVRKPDGEIRGVEAVIDKDLTSALLARIANIDIFIILTAVDFVYVNFNTPEQKELRKVTVAEMEQYLSEGHFKKGSMEPKVKAALEFLHHGGKHAVICHLNKLGEAVSGLTGTHIYAK